jgi:hypothetical protein
MKQENSRKIDTHIHLSEIDPIQGYRLDQSEYARIDLSEPDSSFILAMGDKSSGSVHPLELLFDKLSFEEVSSDIRLQDLARIAMSGYFHPGQESLWVSAEQIGNSGPSINFSSIIPAEMLIDPRGGIVGNEHRLIRFPRDITRQDGSIDSPRSLISPTHVHLEQDETNPQSPNGLFVHNLSPASATVIYPIVPYQGRTKAPKPKYRSAVAYADIPAERAEPSTIEPIDRRPLPDTDRESIRLRLRQIREANTVKIEPNGDFIVPEQSMDEDHDSYYKRLESLGFKVSFFEMDMILDIPMEVYNLLEDELGVSMGDRPIFELLKSLGVEKIKRIEYGQVIKKMIETRSGRLVDYDATIKGFKNNTLTPEDLLNLTQ